ncbi:hypothetical protein I6U48_29390, partial [Clostridium sp. PL3]
MLKEKFLFIPFTFIFLILMLIFLIFDSSIRFSHNYYVSNYGDDSNSGLSEAHPWKTISKVNNYNFKPGDVVHFKCGDIWREQLIPKNGNETGPVTYASYGTGNKPSLYGSVSLSTPSNWIEETPNIWTLNKNTDNTQSDPNYINPNKFLICQKNGAKVNYYKNVSKSGFIKIDSLSSGISMFNVQLLVAELNLTTN